MDANKLKVLQDIGYRILPTCGTCVHRHISPGQSWGTCVRYTYQHQKHTGKPRQLSVYVGGGCQAHEYDEAAQKALEGFGQFV